MSANDKNNVMIIEYNEEWYNNAIYERDKRKPHMFVKYQNYNVKAKDAGQIRGLIIEHHVAGWFKEEYPDEYSEPDNYRQWTRWCPHDFILKINDGRVIYVDVSGPKKNGSFGSSAMKPKVGVDCHIIAVPIGFKSWDVVDYKEGFKMLGVVSPDKFIMTIDPYDSKTIDQWLDDIGLVPSEDFFNY